MTGGRVDGNVGSAGPVMALNPHVAHEVDSCGENKADDRESAQEQSEKNAAAAGVLNFHDDLLPAIRIFANPGSRK
jgi:hypothetical protein